MAITTDKEREIRVAVERIVGFAKQFDEAHLTLACHAAFPLVLTPDLLYQIWAHFVPEAPWSAVARVLLSRLCRQVGYEMYEMDIPVRNLLLKELKEQFGQERLDELAAFLLDYVAQRLTDDDPDTQDLREAQEWTALAYTKPQDLRTDATYRRGLHAFRPYPWLAFQFCYLSACAVKGLPMPKFSNSILKRFSERLYRLFRTGSNRAASVIIHGADYVATILREHSIIPVNHSSPPFP